MEDTIDLKHSRVTLVSALVWRAIAELGRRHHTRHAIRLGYLTFSVAPAD